MKLGGADLHRDLDEIHQAIRRMAPSRASPLGRLGSKLGAAIRATRSVAATIRTRHTLVREVARVFRNDDALDAKAVRERYEEVLDRWDALYRRGGRRASWIAEILLAADAAPRDKLFTCYEHPALPSDDNAHERAWGSIRRHQRRATGQERAPNALVADDGRTACATLLSLLAPLDLDSAARVIPVVPCRARRERSGAASRRSVRLSYRRDSERFLAEVEKSWIMR
jgi:hypothetical protein